MLKLELISGPQKGRLVRISDDAPVPIGRNFGRLRLHDSRVSKHHAQIVYAGHGSWVLRDLGSSNGSFVNQEQLKTLAELEKGDTIQFGRIVIRVREANAKGVKSILPGPATSKPASPLDAFAAESIFDDEPLTTDDADAGDDASAVGIGLTDAALDANEADADAGDDVDLDAMFEEADRNEALADVDEDETDDEERSDASDAPPTIDLASSGVPDVEAPEPKIAQPQDVAQDEDASEEEDADAPIHAAATDDQADEPSANADDDHDAAAANPGLDDQIQIDDELPDAGKMPGTTMVLANDTLAAAAGSDRSKASEPIDQDDDPGLAASDADDALSQAHNASDDSGPDTNAQDRDGADPADDAIGLAAEQPKPSVFDAATDEDDSVAGPTPNESHDHDQDLIRIDDDEPIAPPAAAAEAEAEAEPEAEPEAETAEPEDAATDVEADVQSEVTSEAEVEPAVEPEPEPESPQVAAEHVEPEPEAEPEIEAQAEPDTEIEAPPQHIADATTDSPDTRDETHDDLGHSSGTWLVSGIDDPAPAHEAAHEAEQPHPTEPAEPVAELEDAPAPDAEVEEVVDAGIENDVDVGVEAEDEDEIENDVAAQVDKPVVAQPVVDQVDQVDESQDDQSDEADEGATHTSAAVEAQAAPPSPQAPADSDAPDESDTSDADAPPAQTPPTPPPPNVGYLRAALAHLVSDEPQAPAPSVSEPTATVAAPGADPGADLTHIADEEDSSAQGKDAGATDFDAPSPADLDAPAGSAEAIAQELERDEQQEHDAPFPGQTRSAQSADPDDSFGSHLGAPALNPAPNPTSTLPPTEPRTSNRSTPDWANRSTKRRNTALVAGLLLVLLGAGLYVGIFNPNLIAGRDDKTDPEPNTNPTRAEPEPNQTPPNNNPDPTPPTQNPNPNPDNTTRDNNPPTNPYLAAPGHDRADPGHRSGDARTPDPFASLARVLGADALIGRTTDDPNIGRPNTPDPQTPTVPGTPGNTLPPIVLPEPGGSTNPQPGTEPRPAVGDGNDNTPRPEPTDPNAPTDGERIVFLVDCSGSMVDSLPQMLVWLREAIDTLEPEKRFTIIFFKKDSAIEPEPAGLRPLTRATQRELNNDWLDPDAAPVLPSGRSDPDKAIALALTYNPSDIYILSDESFGLRTGDTTPEDAVTLFAQALGEAELRVHGVQFFYDDRDGTLEAIAERFSGTYEFVAEARHPDQDPIDLLEELENRNP